MALKKKQEEIYVFQRKGIEFYPYYRAPLSSLHSLLIAVFSKLKTILSLPKRV
jgi:hypothetical protein